MNIVKCESCNYGVPVDENEQAFLCDNPDIETYGKNVKHEKKHTCKHGKAWDKGE